MKKFYSKPQILFEDFSLSTNIATCDLEVNSSYGTCAYDDGQTPAVFTVNVVSGCVMEGEGGKVCYDNPSANSRCFNS